MPDKKFPSGTHITITLKRHGKKDADSQGSLKRKRPVIENRRSGVDKRRLSGSKTRFFDLGHTAAGVTNPFYVYGSVGVPYPIPIYGYDLAVDPLALFQIMPLTDGIIATNVNNFKSTYREVKPSDSLAYGILIEGIDEDGHAFSYDSTVSYPNWTDKGLKLTDKQVNGTQLIFKDRFYGDDPYESRGCLFGAFDVKDTVSYKFTSSYDYGAAEVSYTYENGDIFYFVPSIVLVGGFSGTTGTFPITYTTYWLNLYYRIRPRDYSNPSAVYRCYADYPDFTEAKFTEVLNRIVAQSPLWNYRFRRYSDGTTPSNVQTLGQGLFPITPQNFRTKSVWYENMFTQTGMLQAVIQKGNDFYYLWEN